MANSCAHPKRGPPRVRLQKASSLLLDCMRTTPQTSRGVDRLLASEPARLAPGLLASFCRPRMQEDPVIVSATVAAAVRSRDAASRLPDGRRGTPTRLDAHVTRASTC